MLELKHAELGQALAILDGCGIRHDDANTTLAHALEIADSTNYAEWLTSIKKLSNGDIFRVYGMDSGRAVASLARYA